VERRTGTWTRTGENVVVRYPISPATGATVFQLRVRRGGAELAGPQELSDRVWLYERQ
jgi:hypothetical protein